MACQIRMGDAKLCDRVFDALGDQQARSFPRGVFLFI